MHNALVWIEFIIAILLVATIMLQHRGTGLGGAFASEANVYRSKRGIEKFLFNSTIVLGALLVVGALTNLFLQLKVSL